MLSTTRRELAEQIDTGAWMRRPDLARVAFRVPVNLLVAHGIKDSEPP
jgi:hypothetical protein